MYSEKMLFFFDTAHILFFFDTAHIIFVFNTADMVFFFDTVQSLELTIADRVSQTFFFRARKALGEYRKHTRVCKNFQPFDSGRMAPMPSPLVLRQAWDSSRGRSPSLPPSLSSSPSLSLPPSRSLSFLLACAENERERERESEKV